MNNDLISRSALKESIKRYASSNWLISCNEVLDRIDNAPAVELLPENVIETHTKIGYDRGFNDGYAKCVEDNERPQGEWILVDDTEKFIAKCSVCGRIEDSRMVKDYPFCHCGAEMRGAESHLDNTPTVAINKDFYKIDKSNPINRSDLFQ